MLPEKERQHFNDVSELPGLATPEARPFLGIPSSMSQQMSSRGEKKYLVMYFYPLPPRVLTLEHSGLRRVHGEQSILKPMPM